MSLCRASSFTRGNLSRQLGGNQLQSMLPDYFDNTWSLRSPKKNMWKFKCECLFFLEIAWNWLPVKWQFQVATVLFFQSYSNFSLFICILIAKKDSKRVQGVALQNNINRYVGLPIIPKLIFYGFFCRPTIIPKLIFYGCL